MDSKTKILARAFECRWTERNVSGGMEAVYLRREVSASFLFGGSLRVSCLPAIFESIESILPDLPRYKVQAMGSSMSLDELLDAISGEKEAQPWRPIKTNSEAATTAKTIREGEIEARLAVARLPTQEIWIPTKVSEMQTKTSVSSFKEVDRK